MAYKNVQDLYDYQRKRWTERKLKAIEYLGGKCIDCGITHHPKLFEFHHRDPTDKEYSWKHMRQMNWTKVLAELDKCDLLCPNCHAYRHLTPNELRTLG